MESPSQDPSSDAGPEIFQCPGCGEDVQTDRRDAAHLSTCPYCSEQMLIPAIDGSTDLPDESPARTDAEEELDGLRVRTMSLSRRAAMRARTYCLLAGAGGLYVAWLAGRRAFATLKGGLPWSVMVAAWTICAAISIAFAIQMFRRARCYERESREPMIEEPTVPPDFTPLSDGSQYTENLEGMRRNPPQQAEPEDRKPA